MGFALGQMFVAQGHVRCYSSFRIEGFQKVCGKMELRVSAHMPVMDLARVEIGISNLRRQPLSPDQPETLELREDDNSRFRISNQHIYQMCPPLAFSQMHYIIMTLVLCAILLREKETFQGRLIHLFKTDFTDRSGCISQDNRHCLPGTEILLSLGQLFIWNPGFKCGVVNSTVLTDNNHSELCAQLQFHNCPTETQEVLAQDEETDSCQHPGLPLLQTSYALNVLCLLVYSLECMDYNKVVANRLLNHLLPGSMKV